MIQSIEDKSKRELVEIVKIQLAEFQKLDEQLTKATAKTKADAIYLFLDFLEHEYDGSFNRQDITYCLQNFASSLEGTTNIYKQE
ncbi:hypothetical protein BAE46_01055 [Glaciecola punicea]|uniref:hypothetical protein n=1 Tax=Glaciecola punicea TaxID=56804 RepID=UPI00087272DA|nr:hypothetical protein [Glaciecola punicea]OFA33331.1 hypothetical protein BAE46_01055 [Glaciecola punicea]